MSDIEEVEILLVEDNPADVELALRALKKNKIANKIIVVSDGEEAIDFLFSRGAFSNREGKIGPKVIILDLKLPKVDGLEVLQAIKSDPRTKLIPVVVLTSSKEESDIIASYQLGVNSYIIKPVDFEKFVEAVKTLGFYWLLFNQAPKI
jgi:CheY-like chemotaxis protein